jgi:hypothetical protein
VVTVMAATEVAQARRNERSIVNTMSGELNLEVCCFDLFLPLVHPSRERGDRFSNKILEDYIYHIIYLRFPLSLSPKGVMYQGFGLFRLNINANAWTSNETRPFGSWMG